MRKNQSTQRHPSKYAMKFPEIEKAVIEASPISINDKNEFYEFYEYAFGEHGTHVPHSLVKEVVLGFSNLINEIVDDFDLIVSPEPGGHSWGLLLGHLLQKDVIVLRNHAVGVNRSSKIVINGYSKKQLNYTPVNPESKVIVVDDIISSGATLQNIIENVSASILGIYAIYSKGNRHREIMNRYNIPIHVLVEGLEFNKA